MKNIEFETATPESQGVPSSAILSFIEECERERLAIDSLIIMRHGKILAEGYWAPFEKGDPHRLFSAGKALVSTAILFAIQEGLLSLTDLVVDLLPEDVPEGLDDKWSRLTLYHLLTMHTGHSEDTMRKMFEAGEYRAKAFFEQKLTFEPGTHFLYNNGVPDMLGIILFKVTGQRVYEYLKPRLFDVLEMDSMYVAPNGHLDELPTMTASTHSLLKLTLLYFQRGKWNGKQILDSKLTDMAVSYLVPSLQDPQPPMVAHDTKFGYGFQIWRSSVGGFRIDGGRGQFGIGIPEMDLVVVINATEQDQGILPITVWKHITNRLFAAPITENPKQYQLLMDKLSSLTWAAADKAVPEENYTGTYELQKEFLGIKKFSFDIKDNKLFMKACGDTCTEICAGTLGAGVWNHCKTVFMLPSTAGLIRNLSLSTVTGEDPSKSIVCACFSDKKTLEIIFRSKGYMDEQRFNFEFNEEGGILTYETGTDYNLKKRSPGCLNPGLKDFVFDHQQVSFVKIDKE